MKKPVFSPPSVSQFSSENDIDNQLIYLDPNLMNHLYETFNLYIKNSLVFDVGFKKTNEKAKLPLRKHSSDTGYDIFAVENKIIEAKSDAVVETGIEVAQVPEGYWYLILPRSGLGFVHGIQPHLGVIDNGYRGSLAVKLYNFSNKNYEVKEGDRIAQIAFFPLVQINPYWSEQTEETDRGVSGFGSSGK